MLYSLSYSYYWGASCLGAKCSEPCKKARKKNDLFDELEAAHAAFDREIKATSKSRAWDRFEPVPTALFPDGIALKRCLIADWVVISNCWLRHEARRALYAIDHEIGSLKLEHDDEGCERNESSPMHLLFSGKAFQP